MYVVKQVCKTKNKECEKDEFIGMIWFPYAREVVSFCVKVNPFSLMGRLTIFQVKYDQSGKLYETQLTIEEFQQLVQQED